MIRLGEFGTPDDMPVICSCRHIDAVFYDPLAISYAWVPWPLLKKVCLENDEDR